MTEDFGLDSTPRKRVLDLFSLKGQTALITGGSRGIGAAIALALSDAGAFVILAQRDPADSKTRNRLDQRPGSAGASTVDCDLSKPSTLGGVFETAVRSSPTGSIDILVNCAGVLEREDTIDVTLESWNQVVDINLNSLFVLCQAAARHMIPRRSGSIINVASLNSYIGGFRVASYTASKAAVAGLTKAMSNEWAKHNIRVNSIAPGSIATDINEAARQNPEFVSNRLKGTPGGRWGAPEDFMGPAVFLASGASQFVTGETLIVDGGAMAKGPI